MKRDWAYFKWGKALLIGLSGFAAIFFLTSTFRDELFPSKLRQENWNLEQALKEKDVQISEMYDARQLDTYLDIGWGRAVFTSENIGKGKEDIWVGPNKEITADVHEDKGNEILYFTKDKKLMIYAQKENTKKQKGSKERGRLIAEIQAFDKTSYSPFNIIDDGLYEIFEYYTLERSKGRKKMIFTIYKFFGDNLEKIWFKEFEDNGEKWFKRFKLLRREGTNTYNIKFDNESYWYNSESMAFERTSY